MPNIVKVPVFTIDELAPEVRERVIENLFNGGNNPFDLFVYPDWQATIEAFIEAAPVDLDENFNSVFKYSYAYAVVKDDMEAIANLKGKAAYDWLKANGYVKLARNIDDNPMTGLDPDREILSPLAEYLKSKPNCLPHIERIFADCLMQWGEALKEASESFHTDKAMLEYVRNQEHIYTKNGHIITCYKDSLEESNE